MFSRVAKSSPRSRKKTLILLENFVKISCATKQGSFNTQRVAELNALKQ
jgi:hypothetical protein